MESCRIVNKVVTESAEPIVVAQSKLIVKKVNHKSVKVNMYWSMISYKCTTRPEGFSGV
jgi:hypothetical protein